MLVDQQQGVELSLAKLGDARRDVATGHSSRGRARSAIAMAVCEITRHQHEWPFTAKDKIRQSTFAPADNDIVEFVLSWRGGSPDLVPIRDEFGE